MHSSRPYPYDEQEAQIPSYSAPAQRLHQASPNFPTPAQALNRSPYDELHASYFSQHQLPTGGMHPREGAPYVPAQPSQYVPPGAVSTQYTTAHSRHVVHKHSLDERHSYAGYLYGAPSPQLPVPSQFSRTQDLDRPFIPTPSEMTNVYSNHACSSRLMVPSQHPFEQGARRTSRPPQLPNSIGATTHVATQVMNPLPISSPVVTERYPCEKCGKTFSR